MIGGHKAIQGMSLQNLQMDFNRIGKIIDYSIRGPTNHIYIYIFVCAPGYYILGGSSTL